MVTAKRFGRQVFIVYAATIFGSLSAYGIRILYSRTLSMEDYGLFYAVMSLLSILTVVRGIGLPSSMIYYGIKEFTKKQYSNLKTIIVFGNALQLINSVVISLLIAFFSDVVITRFLQSASHGSWVLLYMLAYFVITTISTNTSLLFSMFEQAELTAIHTHLNMILVLPLSLILFKVLDAYKVPVISHIISQTILFVVYGLLFYSKHEEVIKAKLGFDSKLFKGLIRYGLLIAASTAGVIILGDIDTVLISWIKGVKAVALYNVARPTALLVSNFSTPFLVLLFPTLTMLWHSKKQKAARTTVRFLHNIALLISLPLALGMIAFSKQLINIVFGSAYVKAWAALSALAIARIVIVLYSIPSALIASIGKPGETTRIIYIGAVTNTVVDLLLIPYMGILGAALGTLTALLVMYAESLRISIKYAKISLDIKDLFSIIASAIIFYIILLVFKNFTFLNYWLRLGIGLMFAAIGYLAALIGFRVITKTRLKLFLKLLPKEFKTLNRFFRLFEG